MGDSSSLLKPKRLPWHVVERIPDMLNSYFEQHTETRTIGIAFHGGEPLLVGKEFFRDMVNFIRDKTDPSRVNMSLQTNAMLIDKEWVNLLKILQIPVAASLDGPPHINDRRRIYRDGSGSSQRAVEGIRLLTTMGEDFAGVLCVVDHEARGAEVVDYFIDELGIKWFDFLLPDYTHDQIPDDWQNIQDALLRFLIEAFDRWFERLNSGVSCRFFESIIARGMGRSSSVDTIGRDGVTTVVLETDGTLEPHDVARICSGFDRSTGITVRSGALQELVSSAPYAALANEPRKISSKCLECSQYQVCRGGHLFHRFSKQDGFSNPSVHCTALFNVINHINLRMAEKLQAA